MKTWICIMMLAAALLSLWGCGAAVSEDEIPEKPSKPDPVIEKTEAPDSPSEPAPVTVPVTEPIAELQTEPEAPFATEPVTIPTPDPDPLPATEPASEPEPESVLLSEVLLYEDMKAMWLSQFDLTSLYLNGNTQRNAEEFTGLMAQVLDLVKSQGFNTVFLQVRPYADSMYPSACFPMSAYVTGQIGSSAQYDPVEIIVRLAHDRDLSIHAWINPLRGMTENEILSVGSEYAVRRWYDDPQLRGRYLVLVSGRWYLNPAYEEVRDLICAGAEEALNLYDFDGLHMDDYFYPTTDESYDSEAYSAYQSGGGTLNLADFRRDQISTLVRRLFEITHNSRAGRIFGISPAGNVDTVFNSQYADVYQWCGTSGYIDYICPQVYFGLEHGSHDFVKVCNTYQNMIKTDSVDLIVGMTFGKAFSKEDTWAGAGKDEWKNNRDVLARCLQTTSDLERCRGVAVFCYQYFFDPLTGQSVPETKEERENFVPVLQDITWN